MRKLSVTGFLLFIGILSFSFPSSTGFADTVNPINVSENSISLSLENNQTRFVEQKLFDDNGNDIGSVVLEDISIQPRSISSSPLSNKTYSVKFISGSLNVGYTVSVNNKKITNAYNPWTNGLLWNASLGTLSYNSSQATLNGKAVLGFKGFGANTTFRLFGRIRGNQFVTDVSVP